jgi:hypothetical protein
MNIILISIVMVLLTSCDRDVSSGTPGVPADTGSKATTVPETILTATLAHNAQQTLEPTPSITPSITSFLPTPTPFLPQPDPTWIIFQGDYGTIFYKRVNDQYYVSLNLETGQSQELLFPDNCKENLLPNRIELLCRNDKQVYLFNLLSQARIDVPIEMGVNEVIIGFSANGSHIFIIEFTERDKQTLYLYDIKTGSKKVLEINLPFSPKFDLEIPLMNSPALSADAKYLAFIGSKDIHSLLFIYDIEQDQIVIPSEKSIGSGIQWSPVDHQLVFGIEADPLLEAGFPEADQLLLYDMDSGKLTELPTLETILKYSLFPVDQQTIWSPDQRFILVSAEILGSTDSYFSTCAIQLESLEIQCSKRTSALRSWAPDKSHWIEFSFRTNSLTIYSNIETIEKTLNSLDEISLLAWR